MTEEKVLYISDMPADVAINAQDHNYNKLLAAYCPKELLTAGVYLNHIAHDDNCEIYQHGNCNCECDITIEHAITHEIVFSLRWNAQHRVQWTAATPHKADDKPSSKVARKRRRR